MFKLLGKTKRRALSVNLNSSRDASGLSGFNFVRILELHGSFHESEKC